MLSMLLQRDNLSRLGGVFLN